jgi:hypothetical protein
MGRTLILGLVLGALAGCGIATETSPCRGELTDPADAPVHHDPNLEARFPETVGGESLEVQSLCANSTDTGGFTTDVVLDQLEVQLDDVTVALTTPSIGQELPLSITAVRYYGADEDEIRAAALDSMADAGSSAQEARLGGRTVHVGDAVMGNVVVYVADDTLYLLNGDAGTLEELLATLP